jgi:FMN reductase
MQHLSGYPKTDRPTAWHLSTHDISAQRPFRDGAAAGTDGGHLPLTLLVGHPTPRSRTLAVSTHATRAIRGALASHGVAVAEPALLDLSTIATRLLDDGDAGVCAAVETLRRARLLVVASPTFKGSYTGLLKTFLDLLPQRALAGTVAVPVMTAAAARYRFAVDAYLATVLAELGAAVPCRGLSVLEADFPALDEALATWCATAAPVLAGVLGHTAAPATVSPGGTPPTPGF